MIIRFVKNDQLPIQDFSNVVLPHLREQLVSI